MKIKSSWSFIAFIISVIIIIGMFSFFISVRLLDSKKKWRNVNGLIISGVVCDNFYSLRDVNKNIDIMLDLTEDKCLYQLQIKDKTGKLIRIIFNPESKKYTEMEIKNNDKYIIFTNYNGEYLIDRYEYIDGVSLKYQLNDSGELKITAYGDHGVIKSSTIIKNIKNEIPPN
jgi:hypothetical protein